MGTKRPWLLGKAELLRAETRSLGNHLPVTKAHTSSVTPVPLQSWLRAPFPSQRQPSPLAHACPLSSPCSHPYLGPQAQKFPECELSVNVV